LIKQAKNAQEAAEKETNDLKESIGIAEGQDPLSDRFPDVAKQATTYEEFVAELDRSAKKLSEDLASEKKSRAQAEQEKQAAVEEAVKKQAELEEQVKAKEKVTEDLEKQFNADRAKHEELSKQLAQKQKEALERAERLDLLVAEIGKGEPLLPAARQARFKAQQAEGRIGLLFEELRDREKQILYQNEVLAALRVADKSLQETVLAATPKDDRIDGFDGRILSVNEADRSVLIDVGSTQGLRPGLVFRVYAPGDAQPQVSDDKAVVEVVAIESSALARARIRQESIRDPILRGDRVATSLWKPRTPFETVIVGFAQLDADEKPDQDRLQELVERVGGRVEQLVSSSTTMLVDAGPPRTVGAGTERAAGWRPADDTRRDRQLKEARRLGIQIVGLDAFLEMLGIDRESLESNRLIHAAGSANSPAASGLVE
jgi:hypothetical protein